LNAYWENQETMIINDDCQHKIISMLKGQPHRPKNKSKTQSLLDEPVGNRFIVSHDSERENDFLRINTFEIF